MIFMQVHNITQSWDNFFLNQMIKEIIQLDSIRKHAFAYSPY